MLEGKAVIKETDMPMKMQVQALASASRALDLYDVFDCLSIAASIKKEFDDKYGFGWQCVNLGMTTGDRIINLVKQAVRRDVRPEFGIFQDIHAIGY
ncbi:Dynein light chain, type 1/2 [Dillenia turbinata]|uniref:Dynein light chain n=1 Tax=Dillenia turbinata TaxID=194707 RepID=A0AAN8W2M1_9MAGN